MAALHPPAESCAFVLELPSDTRVIETAVAYLVDRVRAYQFGGSRLNLNFRVGVAEALANAMIYGNGSDPDKRVRVEVELSSDAVALEVRDEGEGFDASVVPDPTLPENLEGTGGRGIFLIRELMDEVRYDPPGNCVRMVLRRAGEK
ncbi:MAG TPA: ATP-binding protein [Longimicrobium sp.]|nr:ATP-binding protein [Longimicrobium sp.]